MCEELFSRIAGKAEMGGKETGAGKMTTTYVVKLSFLEIYNEKIQDLLGNKSKDLKIINDPKRGPLVKGLSEHVVTSWEEVEKLLDKGMETRSVAATAMNDTSSRSHAVVQIALDMEDSLGQVGAKKITRPRRARANLVDLAGSEKVSKSKVEGAGLKEAIGINQSLTCLGRVIDGLVDGDKHVPYRDSVLTLLLADSLGGNSRTTMLAALSPAAVNYDETMSTLRWASRARKIVNKVKINEDPAAALIRELQEELAKMKQQVLSGDMESLQVQLGGQGTGDVMANVATHTAEVQEALAKLEELQAKEEVAEEEREAKWTAERERVENAHAEQIAQLREQQRELAEQKVALEVEHQRLEAGLEDQKRGLFLDKLRHGAQIESAKKKGEETAEQAKKLKRINIANRIRTASQKAQLQELQEAKVDEHANLMKERHDDLLRQLEEANAWIMELEQMPDWEEEPVVEELPGGMLMNPDGTMMTADGQIIVGQNPDGTFITADGRVIGADGQEIFEPEPEIEEDIIYEGPLCDMCLEQPAQFRCMHPPCNGDLLCVWCDANQHRFGPRKGHTRTALAAPCECCGAREAQIVCPGCDYARLCRICDREKHSRHLRSKIVTVPCQFCGLRDAAVECPECQELLCEACDELKHRAPARAWHQRFHYIIPAPDAHQPLPIEAAPPRQLPELPAPPVEAPRSQTSQASDVPSTPRQQQQQASPPISPMPTKAEGPPPARSHQETFTAAPLWGMGSMPGLYPNQPASMPPPTPVTVPIAPSVTADASLTARSAPFEQPQLYTQRGGMADSITVVEPMSHFPQNQTVTSQSQTRRPPTPPEAVITVVEPSHHFGQFNAGAFPGQQPLQQFTLPAQAPPPSAPYVPQGYGAAPTYPAVPSYPVVKNVASPVAQQFLPGQFRPPAYQYVR
uniref:Kinesin-like protein n=1 Tax=Eutreptiella gymnastica TaxID=73025 RepID=A0A7S4GPK1_9EUGL